jgi:hypothetical protein
LPARAVPLVVAGLMADAAGQAAGFARGDPDVVLANLLDLEVERVRYVSAADAAAHW